MYRVVHLYFTRELTLWCMLFSDTSFLFYYWLSQELHWCPPHNAFVADCPVAGTPYFEKYFADGAEVVGARWAI